MRAGLDFGNPIGAKVEGGIGRIGIKGRSVAILDGFRLEDRPLDVRRQDTKVVDLRKVEEHAVEMKDKGLLVDHIHFMDALVEFRIGDPRLRVPPHFPGKDDVGGGDRRAVAPGGIVAQAIGGGNALAPIRQGFPRGATVFKARYLGAQHADQAPVLVISGQRAAGHGLHIGLGQHGFDVGVQGRGKLANADAQVARRGSGRQEP